MPQKNHHRPFDEEMVTELLRERLKLEEPSLAFRDALYGKLVRQNVFAVQNDHARSYGIFGLFRWMSAVMVACLVLLIGTGLTTTYAYVSPSVTRESSLYSLKMIVESAELSLHTTPENRARSLLKFAHRRIDELQTLAENGTLDQDTLASIVRYTEDALAQADRAIDASTQAEIRHTVATEAANQRKMLETILSGYQSTDVIGSTNTPTENAPRTTLTVLEDTISKVSTVEVQALKKNVQQNSDDTVNEPNDLSLSLRSLKKNSIDIKENLLLNISVKSTGWSPIEDATLAVDWGDGQKDTLDLHHLSEEHSSIAFSHRYQRAGTYLVRMNVFASADEWTTANNRVTETIIVTGVQNICTFDERRCEDDHIVEVCGNIDGVLGWKRDKICIDDNVCRNGVCTPPICNSTCSSEGTRRCSSDGKNTELCSRKGSCLQWQTSTPCANQCSNGSCVTAKTTSKCGNGIIEIGEQCDDRNTVSGDGCSALCIKESACVDSDGGSVPTVYGTVKYGRDEEKDLCENLNTLLEFTCSVSEKAFGSRINCPFGCVDGACRTGPVCGNGKAEATEQCDDGNTKSGDGCSKTCLLEYLDSICTDSDGGEKAEVQGETRKGDGSSLDACASSSTLTEYVCRNNAIASTTIRCANACQAGACTPATNVCGNGIIEVPEQCDDGNTKNNDGCNENCMKELPCTETDSGSAIYIRGIAAQGTIFSTDTCETTTSLREYVCTTPFSLGSSLIDCAQGCQNGACIPPVCGNGKKESGEGCDDGNQTSGDGCSAVCTIE